MRVRTVENGPCTRAAQGRENKAGWEVSDHRLPRQARRGSPPPFASINKTQEASMGALPAFLRKEPCEVQTWRPRGLDSSPS